MKRTRCCKLILPAGTRATDTHVDVRIIRVKLCVSCQRLIRLETIRCRNDPYAKATLEEGCPQDAIPIGKRKPRPDRKPIQVH
jgi:hypothetical protein